ncbi:MAG TPA: cyclopropane-fatty-acyl-phospholipid synthase family protein [Planctomycetota bacterium]|jgi:cyclopropane-fatty-acyl-phospholipid synthase|nr:cyclopropane-fatty-acyl-phospholipid synthase family protein [Planctomycetota bacterium]
MTPRNPPNRPASFLERTAAKLLLKRLSALRSGLITVIDGMDQDEFGQPSDLPPITIRVKDPAFYRRVLFGGCIGAAESYANDQWDCDQLTALMRLLTRDLSVADGMERGLARVSTALRRVSHAVRSNSRRGSRRNIIAHYDLGNEFFKLWLDPTLAYSSAIFSEPRMSLEAASLAKFDTICRKLQLKPNHRLLEVGCGWGGFSVYAAEKFGCLVTAITISDAQFAYVSQLVEKRGLAARVTVRKEDYRDVRGTFDRIVSIEMIEAVGHRNYDRYFRALSDLLADDGLFLLQAITIADHRYERALKDVDFIQRHIFPGSCIPSIQAIANSVGRRTDMKFVHLADITDHYVLTLRAWRDRFLAASDAITRMGYDSAFQRMWDWYLCYCEGGFAERHIADVQILMAKPAYRGSVWTDPAPAGSQPRRPVAIPMDRSKEAEAAS